MERVVVGVGGDESQSALYLLAKIIEWISIALQLYYYVTAELSLVAWLQFAPDLLILCNDLLLR